MQSDYSQGLVCTSCGTPRSNKSKALCRACYYRISGRENRQQTVLGHATRWAKRIFPGVNSGCTHHWIYPPPNGPTSIGWCRICGANDESANSVHTHDMFLPPKRRQPYCPADGIPTLCFALGAVSMFFTAVQGFRLRGLLLIREQQYPSSATPTVQSIGLYPKGLRQSPKARTFSRWRRLA